MFEQGDVADTVFYIQKGTVKLTVLHGKEAVVAICMNGHALRIATTTAMEDCLITAITKAAMIAALHDEPKFSELFMAYLLTRKAGLKRT